MAELHDGDTVRFQSSRMTVVYKILNMPNYSGGIADLPALSDQEVRDAIALACHRWSEVSNFHFRPANDDKEVCNFTIEFGDIISTYAKYGLGSISDNDASGIAAATVTEARTASDEFITRTIPIVFNGTKRWTSLYNYLRARSNPVDIVSFFQRISDLATAMDLVTVAVHEIGHVLGLGHSKDTQSVMQEGTGIYGTVVSCYMQNHPLPDVDAVALAKRYSGEPSATKLPDPLPAGYAIIGSTYSVSNLTSTAMFKDVAPYCWGDRQSWTVPLAEGYAYNAFLKQRGYAHLSLHLTTADEVYDRSCVIGGGIFNSRSSGLLAMDYPSVPLEGESTGGIAGFINSWNWGRQDGDIRIVGRFHSYLDNVGHDGESLVYFVLRRGNDNTTPPALLKGLYTTIGTAAYKESGRFLGLHWGLQPSTGDTKFSSQRIWPGDDKNKNGYDNANSFTYLCLAT